MEEKAVDGIKNATNFLYQQRTQTIVGSKKRTLADTDTGEIIVVDQITKRVYGSKSFWKCYLMDFLSVLGIIDSKQLDIFIHICQNTNQSNNLFIGTYKEIAEACNVSQPTIAKILKKLVANNFIKKKQNGVWIVNPNILMRGNDYKRQILLSYYNTEKSEEAEESMEVSRQMQPPIQTNSEGIKFIANPLFIEAIEEKGVITE
jgi:DNA-binding Lrp family transcriptional regulator